MKLNTVTVLLMLYLLSFIGCLPCSYASTYSQTYTLENITKIKTIVLEGRTPAYTLYLPLNSQWRVNRLRLKLHLKYSEILLPSSSLTVSVNDIPVETIQLKATQSNSVNWEIDIPRSIIKNAKNIINIDFTGYLKISDDVCADLENKGNWLIIAGDSRVTYDYVYRNSVFELKHFPQPFINKQSLVTDKITLLLPADLSLERFAPYLKLVNILTRDASWRGVDFEQVRFQGFDNLPKDTNSILIGTADTFNFDNLPISLPLRNQHRQWVEDSDLPLAAGKGFVALMPNPNDSTKALMIISANDDHGLENILENINYGALSYQAVLPGFYMAGPPGEQMRLNRDASIMSLKRLGYTDGIVYGDGKQTLSYQFNINHDHTDAPVKLVLQYSHSPFLSNSDPSYMSITINNIPMDGILLNAQDAQKSSLEMMIPAKQLKPGKNQLEVRFDLRMHNKECSRYNLGYAWGTIYDDSYLEFYKAEVLSGLQIKTYTSSLSDRVLLGLPANKAFYQDESMQNSLIQLVSSLKESKTLNIVSNQNMPEYAKDYNLIFLGTDFERMQLAKDLKSIFIDLVHHLAITSNKAFQSIDKSLFEHAFERNQQIGFIGMFPSPLNSNKVALVVYGYNADNLAQALALMNNAYKRSTLTGNLAVAFANGSYTALSAEEIHQQVKTEMQQQEAAELSLKIIIWFGVGVLILVLTLLVFHIRRRK